MLGSQLSPSVRVGGPPAIAIRAADGTYTARTRQEPLAEGFQLCPSFVNPEQLNPFTAVPLTGRKGLV
jgi:hypothetical protein